MIAGEKVIRGGQAVVKSVRARDALPYGPTVTIFATDGTPAAFSRKSMYGPGGARLPLAGAGACRVLEGGASTVKVSG
jgi:hypothetical protein